jgi:hypothetical protein
MGWDFGDPVPLSINITDSNGIPANATLVTLAIDLPDGTVLSVGTINPASTGIYNYDFSPAQYGRHNARWLATGTNAGAFTDSFYVEPANDASFISLDEFKNHLGIVGTENDEKLRGFIVAACQVIADRTGQIVPLVVSEDRCTNGYGYLSLNKFPILSISTVLTLPGLVSIPQMNPITNPHYGWLLDFDTGILNVGSSGEFRISYVAGRHLIPENYILAAKELTAHLWRSSQQNTSNTVGRPVFNEGTSTISNTTYALPYSVRQLLGLDKRPQRGVFVG